MERGIRLKSIAVIGLGLIGGSIAKAVKQNSDIKVIGWNRNFSIAEQAKKDGVIDCIWEQGSLCADLVVIAFPPDATIAFLEQNAERISKGTVVTDVCGIKRHIVTECEKVCGKYGLAFIGGHPMAGKEKGGYSNSDAKLFNGASYIITPSENTLELAVAVMKEFVNILKVGRLTVTTPENHDRMIAFTSQLPHVLAGAYVKSPSCPERKGYSAGSFMDVSRVATADENLWSELFLYNGENLCREIDTLIANLKAYRDAIREGDREKLCAIIKEGRLLKEADLGL